MVLLTDTISGKGGYDNTGTFPIKLAFSNVTDFDKRYGSNIATINPFRYRGYYYDVETGLYYLQSRYYDSTIGRFINADDISYLAPEMIGGLNLYAYCGNNPVMAVDPSGYDPKGNSWESFWRGVGRVITGALAIVAGALVIASGVALIPMLIVAGVTIAVGH